MSRRSRLAVVVRLAELAERDALAELARSVQRSGAERSALDTTVTAIRSGERAARPEAGSAFGSGSTRNIRRTTRK